MKSIVVWDLPTRVFHWALAGSVILALIITEDEGALYAIHAILGVIALVLVLFRLVWGFVGGEHARFADFVARWSAVRRYVGQLLRLAPPRHIGHNPLGGWAVLVLLALTLLTAGTGVLAGGFAGAAVADATSDIHEAFASLLQFMVFIHIAGVLIDWALTRDNLVAAMWHGRKRVEDAGEAAIGAADARGGSVWLAAIMAAPLVVLGAYVVGQIDLTQAPGESEIERDNESDSDNGSERD
jgi:cytochrome b